MKKTIITLLAFAAMIWALYEQTKPQPNYYIILPAVAFFGYYLMRLMNKTKSNHEKNNQPEDEE